jgi:hypothetical protein
MSDSEYLKKIFRQVNDWAIKQSKAVSRLSLHVGCPLVYRMRRFGNPRALMHVGHYKRKVCTVPVAAKLPIEYIVGLFLHEIGHPLALRIYNRSEQWDADLNVKELLGVKIHYKGPYLLECVDKKDVKKILG